MLGLVTLASHVLPPLIRLCLNEIARISAVQDFSAPLSINHTRCVNALSDLPAPLVTTWSCFTEAMYLLGRYGGWSAQQELWGYVADQILVLHFNSEDEQARMPVLMKQYRDLPMDLADASLVAAAEVLNQKRIFTLDRDFQIYRFKGNQPFDVVP